MKIEVYESENKFLSGFLFVIDRTRFILVDNDSIESHYFVSIPEQSYIILDWFITISSKKIKLESLMTHPDREIRRFASNLMLNGKDFIESVYSNFHKEKSIY